MAKGLTGILLHKRKLLVKESRDGIAYIWGIHIPDYGEWPSSMDERIAAEPDKWFRCLNDAQSDIILV